MQEERIEVVVQTNARILWVRSSPLETQDNAIGENKNSIDTRGK